MGACCRSWAEARLHAAARCTCCAACVPSATQVSDAQALSSDAAHACLNTHHTCRHASHTQAGSRHASHKSRSPGFCRIGAPRASQARLQPPTCVVLQLSLLVTDLLLHLLARLHLALQRDLTRLGLRPQRLYLVLQISDLSLLILCVQGGGAGQQGSVADVIAAEWQQLITAG